MECAQFFTHSENIPEGLQKWDAASFAEAEAEAGDAGSEEASPFVVVWALQG